MARAYSISEIIAMKHERLTWSAPWVEAYGRPESNGLISILGHSGNGKTSLALQLAGELSRVLGRGYYNSHEEGVRATLQDLLLALRMDQAEYRRKIIFTKESKEEMLERFAKHKAPKWAIVDSYQLAELTRDFVKEFMERNPKVLLVLILRAEGKRAETAGERKAWYDADLKIWTEGYRGISHGRTNAGGYYTCYEQGAADYWGGK